MADTVSYDGSDAAESAQPTDSDASWLPEWREGDLVDGTFRVVREIGRGGMGVVHLARMEGTETPVAIKSPLGGFLRKPKSRRFFTREASVWLGLQGHPNILPLLAIREVDYLPRLVMVYCEHGALQSRVGKVRAAEALELALQICWGIEFAHRRGVIHRDLKPQNVLMVGPSTAAVADFGLARPPEETDFGEGVVVGTPHYMPPEQWMPGPVSRAVDIYAFGVLLFELLTGRHPFHGATLLELRAAHATQAPPEPAELPRPIRDVILACLAKKPEGRPPDFATVAAAIARAYRESEGRDPEHATSPVVEAATGTVGDDLQTLAEGAYLRCDYADAERVTRDAIAVFEKTGDTASAQAARSALARVASGLTREGLLQQSRGHADRAMEMLDRALSIRRTIGERASIVRALANAANGYSARGEFGRAIELNRERLELARQMGDAQARAQAACDLAWAQDEGGVGDEGTVALYDEAIEGFEDAGDEAGTAQCWRRIRMRADPQAQEPVVEKMVFAVPPTGDPGTGVRGTNMAQEIDAVFREGGITRPPGYNGACLRCADRRRPHEDICGDCRSLCESDPAGFRQRVRAEIFESGWYISGLGDNTPVPHCPGCGGRASEHAAFICVASDELAGRETIFTFFTCEACDGYVLLKNRFWPEQGGHHPVVLGGVIPHAMGDGDVERIRDCTSPQDASCACEAHDHFRRMARFMQQKDAQRKAAGTADTAPARDGEQMLKGDPGFVRGVAQAMAFHEKRAPSIRCACGHGFTENDRVGSSAFVCPKCGGMGRMEASSPAERRTEAPSERRRSSRSLVAVVAVVVLVLVVLAAIMFMRR